MYGDETTRTGSHLDIDGRALDAVAVRALYELLGEDREALAEIVDAFLDEGPRRLAELRRGVDEDDAVLAGRAAHTLKSNGATVGAGDFSERCGELEERAKNGDLNGTSELIDGIEREYGQLHEALGAIRPGESAAGSAKDGAGRKPL